MSILGNILPPRVLYVKIMKNKLEAKDIQSGKVISRNAAKPFSNDRLLIAHLENADNLLREIIGELLGSPILSRRLHTLLQPIDDNIKEISPVEYMIYNDFAQFGGASLVTVCPNQQNLSDSEVLEYLKRGN